MKEVFPATDRQEISEPIAVILDTFPELKNQELPIDKFLLDEIFLPNVKTRRHHYLNDLLVKLIGATAPLLCEKILQKDESVHRVASGIAYFPFEIPYANGLLTWPMNYYALICTDRRLIIINLDYHLSHPKQYVFQVPFENITGISRGFYGSSLIVTTIAGKKWDFTTVNRRLATSIENYIRNKQTALTSASSEILETSQLCPACYQSVEGVGPSCPHCATPYKSAGIAIKKSLLLPGSGNIYLGNQYLGTIEFIGYIFTWIMTIFLVIIGIPGGIAGGVILVMSYHFLAAFMTGRMAGKGNLIANVNLVS